MEGALPDLINHRRDKLGHLRIGCDKRAGWQSESPKFVTPMPSVPGVSSVRKPYHACSMSIVLVGITTRIVFGRSMSLNCGYGLVKGDNYLS